MASETAAGYGSSGLIFGGDGGSAAGSSAGSIGVSGSAGSGIGGGGGLTELGGTVASGVGQMIANKKAKKAATKAFKRQIWLYSHRYQMEVEDLKAAGLNPLLAVDAGAGSVPGVAMQDQPRNIAEGAAESARGFVARMQELEMRNKQNKILDNEIAKSMEAVKNLRADTELKDAQYDLAQQDAFLAQQSRHLRRQEVNESISREEMNQASARQIDVRRYIEEQLIPGAVKRGDIDKSEAGTLMIWLDRVMKSASPFIRGR